MFNNLRDRVQGSMGAVKRALTQPIPPVLRQPSEQLIGKYEQAMSGLQNVASNPLARAVMPAGNIAASVARGLPRAYAEAAKSTPQVWDMPPEQLASQDPAMRSQALAGLTSAGYTIGMTAPTQQADPATLLQGIRTSKVYKDMDMYNATGIAEGWIEGSPREQAAAWQKLVDTGQVWKLQGFFGRTAQDLLDNDMLLPPIESHTDFYGNVVKGTGEKAFKPTGDYAKDMGLLADDMSDEAYTELGKKLRSVTKGKNLSKLLKEDKALNNISLKNWDKWAGHLSNPTTGDISAVPTSFGFPQGATSLSYKVGILKEMARRIITGAR